MLEHTKVFIKDMLFKALQTASTNREELERAFQLEDMLREIDDAQVLISELSAFEDDDTVYKEFDEDWDDDDTYDDKEFDEDWDDE